MHQSGLSFFVGRGNMENLILLIFLIIFTVTDIKMFKIFNIIAYPAIFISLVYTGFWLECLCAFTLLATLLYNKKMNFGGGDVKLFMLIAALKGWLFIPLFIFTFGLIKAYRIAHNCRLGLPVSPFALASFIMFQLTITMFSIVLGIAV